MESSVIWESIAHTAKSSSCGQKRRALEVLSSLQKELWLRSASKTRGEKQKRKKKNKSGEKTNPHGHDLALSYNATSSTNPINPDHTAIIRAAQLWRIRLDLLMVLPLLGAGAKEAFGTEQRLPAKGKWWDGQKSPFLSELQNSRLTCTTLYWPVSLSLGAAILTSPSISYMADNIAASLTNAVRNLTTDYIV